MDDLIKALTIFRQYGNPEWPTHCEHDQLYVDIHPEDVSPDHIKELEDLGFLVGSDDTDGGFYSFKFGSC